MKNVDFDPENIIMPPELQGRQWLTFEEFGALAGVGTATVRGWGRKGIVKVTKFTQRCRRIPATEVERLKNGELLERSTS